MSDDSPSIISHVSVGTNDFERAAAFYDEVLTTLGCRRVMEHPGAVAYGKAFPEFWVQTPIDGNPSSVGNGTHIGFIAPDLASVDAFHRAALNAGAADDGPPIFMHPMPSESGAKPRSHLHGVRPPTTRKLSP